MQVVNEAARVGPTTLSVLDLVFIDSKITDYAIDGLSDLKLALLCIKKKLPAKRNRETINVKNFATEDVAS